jgi:murein DD-endopeptidase MepM/ murein hydrolase activator NlpD
MGKKRKHANTDSRLLSRFVDGIKGVFSHKFTIMLIPHSEKRVVNLQMNTMFFSFICLVFASIVFGFIFLSTNYTTKQQDLAVNQVNFDSAQANLDSVIDEVSELIKVYRVFENAMQSTLGELNIASASEDAFSGHGDIEGILDLEEVQNNTIREVFDIRRLRGSISDAIEPINQISNILAEEKQLLSDIPSLWPVVGGRDALTMEFGPNVHPIRDEWYLHKGVDIAGPVGLPIVAAANGKVVESRLDQISGYGNTIIVEHKYGFRTRYSHMSRRLVNEGEEVYQGQQLGLLGNTGLSSGAHLDFQVMLGTEVLDPATFLTIKNEFIRWFGNR